MDRVNQKLDELNTYSDRTIYSLADMTENIGKFTNAGVNLDDAVAAIQGVANVAAVSGANANEASHAIISTLDRPCPPEASVCKTGSPSELANMATVEFKEQLIDTALELGTLVKGRMSAAGYAEGGTVWLGGDLAVDGWRLRGGKRRPPSRSSITPSAILSVPPADAKMHCWAALMSSWGQLKSQVSDAGLGGG